MRVLTDYPERIPQLKAIYLAEGINARHPKQHHVSTMRMHQGYALLRLANVPDRNAAEPLRGLMVLIDISEAVPLEDDEIYLFQLIGMQVETIDGLLLGPLTDVIETGANDVYVVKSDTYGEVLIPVTDETLIETNTDTQRILMRLPEGLLPDRDPPG